MERQIRSTSDLVIGSAEQLDRERARLWRERTHQERADLFVDLMRVWKPDAPGLARIFKITSCS